MTNAPLLLVVALLMTAPTSRAAPVDIFWFRDGGEKDGAPWIDATETPPGAPVGLMICLFSDHTYYSVRSGLARKSIKEPKDLLLWISYFAKPSGYWEYRGEIRIYFDTKSRPPSAKPQYVIRYNPKNDAVLRFGDGKEYIGKKLPSQPLPPAPKRPPFSE